MLLKFLITERNDKIGELESFYNREVNGGMKESLHI
jgi:hypothetical protein